MAGKDSSRLVGRAGKGARASYGSRTDVGCVREQNEDSLAVNPPLYVVADGMGGHAAGEIASEIAVRTLTELAPEYADAEALGQAVEQANRNIINAALAGEGRDGMGTTCTAAILDGTKLVIAQVGDSRAYLLHRGRLMQLTHDHSLVANMIDAGQLTPEEARVHPNRSVITRALGNDPTTTPDLYEIDIEEGDRLLLCTDGLSSTLEDDEMQAVLNRISDPQQCASMLVSGALAAGGLDNVTVVIVNVEGDRARKHKRLALRTRITAFMLLALLALCIGGAAWGGSVYLHQKAYLAASENDTVNVYRGVPGEVLGFSYSKLEEETDIPISKLPPSAAEDIRSDDGMPMDSVEEALQLVEYYRTELAVKPDGSSSAASASSANTAASPSASSSAASDSTEASETSTSSATSTDESESPAEDGGQN